MPRQREKSAHPWHRFAPLPPPPGELATRATRNERNTRIPSPSRRTAAGLAQICVRGDPLQGPSNLLTAPSRSESLIAPCRSQRNRSVRAPDARPRPRERRYRSHRLGLESEARERLPAHALARSGPERRGAARCRQAPRPRAGGDETKAEPRSVSGTAAGTAVGASGTRARCRGLPVSHSGGAPDRARGANEEVPAPLRRPPKQHRTPPATALNGADPPLRHSPRTPLSGGERWAAAAGTGTTAGSGDRRREQAGSLGTAPRHVARPVLCCRFSTPITQERSKIKRSEKKESHFIGDFTMLGSTIKVLVHSRKVGPKMVLCHSIYQLT